MVVGVMVGKKLALAVNEDVGEDVAVKSINDKTPDGVGRFEGELEGLDVFGACVGDLDGDHVGGKALHAHKRGKLGAQVGVYAWAIKLEVTVVLPYSPLNDGVMDVQPLHDKEDPT
jgi:hypothetical protein